MIKSRGGQTWARIGHRVPLTRTRSRIQPPITRVSKISSEPGSSQLRVRFRWWWQVQGSNLGRLSRRFYRPLPLATRATCQGAAASDGTVQDSRDRHVEDQPTLSLGSGGPTASGGPPD